MMVMMLVTASMNLAKNVDIGGLERVPIEARYRRNGKAITQ